MSRKELEKLGNDVDKALDKMRKQDLKKVRAEMEKMAAAHGVSVEDVISGKPKTKAKAAPKASKPQSAPKYANPTDPTQTWTGKGRQPEWYKAAINDGKTPDSMAL